MKFFTHSGDTSYLSKERFSDLSLSLAGKDANAIAGTREWVFANVRSFKDQLGRLERSMAFNCDFIYPGEMALLFHFLFLAIDKAASDETAEAIVGILASTLRRINHLSCLIIDSSEKFQEMEMELYEANLEAAEELAMYCVHNEDANLSARLAVIHNRCILQSLRKIGLQKGKEVWSGELMAKEDAEFKMIGRREAEAAVAREQAEKENKDANDQKHNNDEETYF